MNNLVEVYREITQEYAKGAIKTVVLINSGGILATLNQVEPILNFSSISSVKIAIIVWVIGIVFGVASWAAGYKSTASFGNIYLYTDKKSQKREHKNALFYGNITAAAITISLLCFVVGSISIVFKISFSTISNVAC